MPFGIGRQLEEHIYEELDASEHIYECLDSIESQLELRSVQTTKSTLLQKQAAKPLNKKSASNLQGKRQPNACIQAPKTTVMRKRTDVKRNTDLDLTSTAEKQLPSSPQAAYNSSRGQAEERSSPELPPRHLKPRSVDCTKEKPASDLRTKISGVLQGKKEVMTPKMKRMVPLTKPKVLTKNKPTLSLQAMYSSDDQTRKCLSLDQTPPPTLPKTHIKRSARCTDETRKSSSLDLETEDWQAKERNAVPVNTEDKAKRNTYSQVTATVDKRRTVHDLQGRERGVVSTPKEPATDSTTVDSNMKPVLSDCHGVYNSSGNKTKKVLLPNLQAKPPKAGNRLWNRKKRRSKSFESILDSKSVQPRTEGVKEETETTEDAKSPHVPPRLYLLDPYFVDEIEKLETLPDTKRGGSEAGIWMKSSTQSETGGDTCRHHEGSGHDSVSYCCATSRTQYHSTTSLGYQSLVSQTTDSDTEKEGYMEVRHRGAGLGSEEGMIESPLHEGYAEVRYGTLLGKKMEARKEILSICSEPLTLQTISGEDGYTEVKDSERRRLQGRLKQIRREGGYTLVKKKEKTLPMKNKSVVSGDLNTQLRAKLENMLLSKPHAGNPCKDQKVRYV